MAAVNEDVSPPSPIQFDEDAKSEAVDVHKLGRCRPAIFASTWKEVAFVASMLGSLAMAVSTVFSIVTNELWG